MENNNSSERPDGEEQKSKNRIFIIVIVLLVAVIGFLLYNYVTLNDKVDEQKVVIASRDADLVEKGKELDEIRLQYERIREERQQMGLSNDSLNQKIAELDQLIGEVRSSSKLSEQKRDQLNRTVTSLRNDLAQKDREIVKLTLQRDSISQNLTEFQTKMTDSVSRMKVIQDDLSGKVAVASRLKAEEVAISVLNSRGKEKEGNEQPQRRVDKVKVVFFLAKNAVAEGGQREIYLRITDPNGAVLYDLNGGGGIFETEEGDKAFYTAKQTVDFDNTGQRVGFLYNKSEQFEEGTYKIELWADNYKIGNGELIVKGGLF